MAPVTPAQRVARIMEMMSDSRANGPHKDMTEAERAELIGHGFAILLDFLGNVKRIADNMEAIQLNTLPR